VGANPENFEGEWLGIYLKVVADPDILKGGLKVDIFSVVEAVIRL